MATQVDAKTNFTARTNKVLSYSRVSSKEQDKEGFSIAAQQKLLRSYALDNNLIIEREFIDVETAKQTGRASFGELVDFLKKHSTIRTVLVEKTDRLYRNLKDWVILEDLDIEIHLVKEGVVLSRDSRSAEKFVHGIKVLMAKNYIDNLSEEARKGQLEKAEQGYWPTKAPLGFRNAIGPDGKRIIEIDPDVAPVITKMFVWYADGGLSMEEVAEKARKEGLSYRRTGAAVPVSAVHTILRNRIYSGEFLWKGKVYQGRHQPLISVDLFERVQGVIAGRNARKTRRSKRQFTFSTVVTCGHCGCALVGELKKKKYVYYHCTGYKGKCGERYVREEELSARFSAWLKQLSFNDQVFQLVSEGLRASHVDEKREHEEAVARLKGDYDRIQSRLHAMYLDKLDGRIDAAMFDRLSADWRTQQDRCLREISWHQSADQSYLEEGVAVLELAQNAQKLFEQQDALQKRRILNFVLSNCTWKDGELNAEFRQPFNLLAETTAIASGQNDRRGTDASAHSGWLGN
jgi:site-specific DNA recombinase